MLVQRRRPIGNFDFGSPVRFEINPYKNGAGPYPKRLYARLATELAEVLWNSDTVLSIMPVAWGRMKPPKNKTSQMQKSQPLQLSGPKKGVGKEKINAHIPMTPCIMWDFRLLYPPRYVVMIPPRITPEIGAVKVTNIKVAVASPASISRTWFK